MDSKFYVSLEAEELLLEKGYPIKKDTPIYNKHGDVIGCYTADRPTKAEAIDWLESRGFYIDYLYTINGKWDCSIIIPSCAEIIDMGLFKTRLEAEEAAIIKACELL